MDDMAMEAARRRVWHDHVPNETLDAMPAWKRGFRFGWRAALESAWVPVSERLPEKNGWYEVSTTGTTDILNKRVPFVSGDNFCDGEFDDPYVYAWRECHDPAPYKEVETNE